jgi:hypothetical protein
MMEAAAAAAEAAAAELIASVAAIGVGRLKMSRF